MPTRRQITRSCLGTLALVAAAVSGCSMPPGQKSVPAPDANLLTFTTELRGSNEVPPNASLASGSVDAVLNTSTNLLRWRASYSGLSGPATAAHFHGPAPIGANAGVALPWPSPVTSPMEGRAILTPAQVADLMAGRWYANIHTAANPGGELRGQMTLRY